MTTDVGGAEAKTVGAEGVADRLLERETNLICHRFLSTFAHFNFDLFLREHFAVVKQHLVLGV